MQPMHRLWKKKKSEQHKPNQINKNLPQKIPQRPPKSKETKTKTIGGRREEVIACDKRKITEAQMICVFSKTELNIYDGINILWKTSDYLSWMA